jgi:hypothetical protein
MNFFQLLPLINIALAIVATVCCVRAGKRNLVLILWLLFIWLIPFIGPIVPLFVLFKKRQPPVSPLPANTPHPQHRNFARMSIPDALTRLRSGFLYAISLPNGSQTLQENWQKYGAAVLPRELLMPPTGLNVSNFRHDKYVCFLIIFPAPKVAGESYCGFIVAGPTDDWSPETRDKVPVRYFLLERSATDKPTIFEWHPSATKGEEIFDNIGSIAFSQDPRVFVGKILSECYGLKPDA